MAKQYFDIKKMFLASLLIIVAGILLTIAAIIIQVLPAVVPEEYMDMVLLANTIFQILLYPLFFLLFLWSGMRAAGNYGFDIIGAGTVAAFSSLAISLIRIVLNAVLAFAVINMPVGNFAYGSIESVMSSALFDMTGAAGVGISAVCGIGLALIGAMVNFVVGGLGGWIVLRKKFGN